VDAGAPKKTKRLPPSRGHARPSSPLRGVVPPTVSASMVAAGVAVLWESGAVEGELDSDELLVSDIFRAMDSCRHMS